jgi:hypothetical protein
VGRVCAGSVAAEVVDLQPVAYGSGGELVGGTVRVLIPDAVPGE